MRRHLLAPVACLGLVVAAGAMRPPVRIAFPDDPAVLDAKRDLGAKGDGVADDTAALQAGLNASCGTGGASRILYLPDGTYRVTNTLVVPFGTGPWVYGESRDGVTIRLDDRVGSTSVTAVLRTHPSDSRATSADHFMRNFRNLTVDAGDNPQVDGIRWFGNNSSILQDVRVRGNGRTGIDGGFVGQSGPNLIQDVEIDGFETGIRSQWIWGQTLSRVTIRNARSNGVAVSANSVAIEDLVVENTPRALVNAYPNDWTWWGGVVALVGGRFSAQDQPGPAIENSSVLYARDVEVRGYAKALASRTPGGDREGTRIDEYLSHPAVKLFTNAPDSGLRLPIKTEPRVPWETDPARWVCANDHGAANGDDRDDTAALQAAIDTAATSGATTVYLRGTGPGWYKLDGTVRVHGSVRRVIGLGFGRVVAGPEGRFLIDDTSAPAVEFRHLQAFGGRMATYENRSASNTLVVESCDGLILGTGGGDLFVTDCPAHIELRSPRQSLWARQLNPEGTSDEGLVRNHGGRLWILGAKNEGAGVRFRNDNGGRTEVFGLFNYGPGVDAQDRRPIVETDHSAFALMGAREIVFGGHTFPVKVREARDGEVREVEGGGWIGWSLYSGWTPEQLAGATTAARPELAPDGDAFLDAMVVTARTRTAGATLRYTLDGSAPTATSPELAGPLALTNTTTINVRAFAPGRQPGAVRSATYTRLEPREPDPAAAFAGLRHAYHELDRTDGHLPDFASLVPTATGTTERIDLSPRRRDENYALRFAGWFRAPATGVYTFRTASDDGSRLWIGGALVVDNDGPHAAQARSGRVALKAGLHPFAVGYVQGNGEASLVVDIEGPGMKRQPLTGLGTQP